MALLTIADLLSECIDEIPAAAQAPMVRAVNKVIRRIQTEFVEPKRTTFTTRPSYSTGTVAVTIDATLVTFTGTPLSASDPVMLVQIEGDSTWFILTYASTSTGNLSSKWAQATAGTATFTIVYPTTSFANTVGEITKIRHADRGELTFRVGGTCPWLTGIPSSWSPYQHDEASAAPSDDLLRIFLDPAPTDRIVYEAWVKPRTVKLSPSGADTQAIPFSDLWDEAIIQGTLFFLWSQEADKSKALVKSALYEAALGRARGAANPAGIIPRRAHHPAEYLLENRPVTGA